MAARTIAAKLPWNDRAGRFAPLKAAVLVLVCLPMLWLLYQALFIGLGARPLTEAIHQLGDWTVYFLLISLAVTPARRLFGWPKLISVRRIIGLSALAYVLVHLALYIVDSKLDLVFVAREIVLRIYLTIGFVALLGLAILGATSTDGMIRRLGAIRWNRLHRIVYGITVLALIHYCMQSKVDVSQPMIMSGFFFWLMGYRLMARYGIKDGFLPLTALSVAAALLTAATEYAWYALMTGVNPAMVLHANLGFNFGIRPAAWVLMAGLAVTVLAEIVRRLRPMPVRVRQTAAMG